MIFRLVLLLSTMQTSAICSQNPFPQFSPAWWQWLAKNCPEWSLGGDQSSSTLCDIEWPTPPSSDDTNDLAIATPSATDLVTDSEFTTDLATTTTKPGLRGERSMCASSQTGVASYLALMVAVHLSAALFL
ncbi:hypothetical protein FOL47_000093 [Perkinsus chesapeaki]|uniref:Uncharacterized protein n=1 Tax=Perkinsus chesapeaki TaxID=330153 RepID=A0A7J6N3A9_PERCH|nr:hypothetical protein FOL47_000093 [Perkinsus chesapeaki]